MEEDTAFDWFMRDARAKGLRIADYEREYKLHLVELGKKSAGMQRIWRHENRIGRMSDEDLAGAIDRERKRGRVVSHIQLVGGAEVPV